MKIKKQAKTENIQLRVTKEQKSKIEADAKELGMNKSQYLLQLATNKNFVVIQGGQDIAKALFDMNCILQGRPDMQLVRDEMGKVAVALNKVIKQRG